MPQKLFEGVIGTKEVKISVNVQEAQAIHLKDHDSIHIEFSDEIYKDYPLPMGVILKVTEGYYPMFLCGIKAYILKPEGLEEVAKDNPFVKKVKEA